MRERRAADWRLPLMTFWTCVKWTPRCRAAVRSDQPFSRRSFSYCVGELALRLGMLWILCFVCRDDVAGYAK